MIMIYLNCIKVVNVDFGIFKRIPIAWDLKVWFEEFSWNYDVYMFNYDVKVKLWSQLYLPDYDYDVMKWYDVWKFISHIMMMFMKNYDLSERSILTLWC